MRKYVFGTTLMQELQNPHIEFHGLSPALLCRQPGTLCSKRLCSVASRKFFACLHLIAYGKLLIIDDYTGYHFLKIRPGILRKVSFTKDFSNFALKIDRSGSKKNQLQTGELR